MAFIGTLLSLSFALTWIGYTAHAFGLWGVFHKSGISCWKALIPFYNDYLSYKISWRGYLFLVRPVLTVIGLLFLIPEAPALTLAGALIQVLALAVHFAYLSRLSAAFGHGIPFTLGLVFFQSLFFIVLGYDSSRYIGPQPYGYRR